MSKFEIGLRKRYDNDNFIYSCSCGIVRVIDSTLQLANSKCECGNEKFVLIDRHENRTLIPYLEVLHKDRKGFKIKRTNLSLIMNEDNTLKTKANQIQVMEYDLIGDKINIWKNGNKSLEYNYKNDGERVISNNTYQRFFYQVDDNELVKLISSNETGELFTFAYKELSSSQTWGGNKKLYRGLIRLFDNKHMQVLANAGYTNLSRFKERTSYWNRTTVLNREGATPKDIFNLPKFALNIVREDNTISTYEIRQLRESIKKMDGNTFKEMVNIAKDEGSIKKLISMIDTLSEIVYTYNYSNIKKLTLYLFREIKMNQGITNASEGASLLRDYIRMSIKLGQEYEKYPKSLKKEHDITQMNYKVKESEIKQKEFNDKVSSEEYKMLEMKTKEYSIISPTAMDDLIKEGNELSHCVASYVGSIIDGSCNIYFLRKTDDLDLPHATIEVRGGRVRQARGYANRQLTKDEREFITAWAKKKDLVENYYY